MWSPASTGCRVKVESWMAVCHEGTCDLTHKSTCRDSPVTALVGTSQPQRWGKHMVSGEFRPTGAPGGLNVVACVHVLGRLHLERHLAASTWTGGEGKVDSLVQLETVVRQG